jgi:diguanylate cyclase
MLRGLYARWLYPLLGIGFAASISLLLIQMETFASRLLVLGVGAAVAAIVGFAIARREDTLRSLGSLDQLTGLHNRRYFEECLEREVRNAQRHGETLALLVIDLDHLKAINDQLGHHAGDAAICVVAEALRKTCRAADLPARWGGDEFVVLAPHTNAEQAETLVQRIAAAVPVVSTLNNGTWRIKGHANAPEITASVGYAIASPDQPSSLWPASLFAAADRAMYRKKTGARRITGPLLKIPRPEESKAAAGEPPAPGQTPVRR